MTYENIVIGDLNNYNFSLLKEISSFLSEKKINLYFLSGYREDVSSKMISREKLSSVFGDSNIFSVNEEYLSSLLPIDQKIRKEKYKLSEEYIDHYFKVFYLTKKNPLLNSKKTLFVGNDIWTDAYYISEYTSCDVLLISPKLTFNQEDYKKDLKTIPVVKSFNDFKNIIENKTDFDYSKLKSFAKNYLVSKTIGKLDLNLDFEKIYKKS